MTRYWDFTHQMAFTPSLIQQLTQLTGFGMVEFRECAPIPHGLKSGIRYAAWQCIRQLIKAYLLVEKASSQGGIYTSDMMFRLTKSDAPKIARQEVPPE